MTWSRAPSSLVRAATKPACERQRIPWDAHVRPQTHPPTVFGGGQLHSVHVRPRKPCENHIPERALAFYPDTRSSVSASDCALRPRSSAARVPLASRFGRSSRRISISSSSLPTETSGNTATVPSMWRANRPLNSGEICPAGRGGPRRPIDPRCAGIRWSLRCRCARPRRRSRSRRCLVTVTRNITRRARARFRSPRRCARASAYLALTGDTDEKVRDGVRLRCSIVRARPAPCQLWSLVRDSCSL